MGARQMSNPKGRISSSIVHDTKTLGVQNFHNLLKGILKCNMYHKYNCDNTHQLTDRDNN